MSYNEESDKIFQSFKQMLQPSYSITSIGDLGEVMSNLGIPDEDISSITNVFDKLGHHCFVDIEGGGNEDGYQITFHDPGEYLALSRDELATEIQILQDEMEVAEDESQKISYLRKIAEISGKLVTIRVPYQSEAEFLEKRDNLSAYVRIAREIIERS